jgi:hypothetical protein
MVLISLLGSSLISGQRNVRICNRTKVAISWSNHEKRQGHFLTLPIASSDCEWFLFSELPPQPDKTDQTRSKEPDCTGDWNDIPIARVSRIRPPIYRS